MKQEGASGGRREHLEGQREQRVVACGSGEQTGAAGGVGPQENGSSPEGGEVQGGPGCRVPGRGSGASRLSPPSLSPSRSVWPCCCRAVWPQDYVQALTGFCYDGVEGLIYLALFSFVTALMFSSIVCSVPHTWQQKR